MLVKAFYDSWAFPSTLTPNFAKQYLITCCTTILPAAHFSPATTNLPSVSAMAKLQELPVELVCCIAGYLDVGELAGFAQTARKFYHVADPVLYKRAQEWDSDKPRPCANPLRYAAENGLANTMKKCIAAGFDVDMTLNEPIEAGEIQSRSFQRRVEALEGSAIWESEQRGPHMSDDPDGHQGWDALSDDSGDFKRTTRINLHDPYPLPSTIVRQCIRRPLHLAVVGGHDDVVEVLLNHGAEIDAYAQNMCDCPFYRDRHDLHKLSPVDPQAHSGSSSLHLAICHFRESTAKLLLRRAASVRTSWRFLTPCCSALHTAAATGQASLCAFLLDEGYVKDIEDHDGHLFGRGVTALFWAFYNGHWKTTAALLLERGADLNTANPCETGNPLLNNWDDSDDSPGSASGISILSKTFVFEACENGQWREALKLVRLGADVNKGHTSTFEGSVTESPLHALCSNRATQRRPAYFPPIQLSQARDQSDDDDARRQLIQALLQAGADIEAVSNDGLGHTPLYEAASDCFVVVVEILLEAGADVNFQTCEKSTPLLAACSFPPGYRDDPYHADGCHRDGALCITYSTVKLLLDYGANINATDIKGNTALHILCQLWDRAYISRDDANMRLIRLLLERGIDESAKNQSGQTALQVAFLRGSYGICDLLLRFRKVAQPLTSKEISEMVKFLVIQPSQEGMGMLLDLDVNDRLASTSKVIMQFCDKQQRDPACSRVICAYLERKPPSLSAPEKGKLLCLAVKQQCARLIKHMLALKAPPNHLNHCDSSPLSLALDMETDDKGLATLVQDLLNAGADMHFRHGTDTPITPLQKAILCRKIFALKTMLRHRPLRDDRDAPRGVYLHEAVALGPEGREIVNMLLHSGITRTELDGNLDTPLGSFLRKLVNQNEWTWSWQPQDARYKPVEEKQKHFRQLADRICTMIQLLWDKKIDVRARNSGDKSIIGYLASLKLYSGDSERHTCKIRVELASQLRQRVKVVPVAGSQSSKCATLEFQPYVYRLYSLQGRQGGRAQ